MEIVSGFEDGGVEQTYMYEGAEVDRSSGGSGGIGTLAAETLANAPSGTKRKRSFKVEGPRKKTKISSSDKRMKALRRQVLTLQEAYRTGFHNPKARGDISQQLAGIHELIGRVRHEIAGDISELKKYGPKHMNNVLLERLAQAIALPGLKVPPSQGIDSDKIVAFLRQQAPEVFDLIAVLDQLFDAHTGEERFLDTPEAKKLLAEIDEAIAKAFSAENAFELLAPPETMEQFLKWVKDSNDYLMVRSTGAEDTKEATNAGGNISKAYVAATKQAWCEAVGEVVRSYFQPSSLQNRINAGQKPFKEELQLAVTTQPLIGEPIGGAQDPKEIPVSLVLFSNEPLYTDGENFRVMRFSATYGHGEGVVGSVEGVKTDTVTILISETTGMPWVLYDNQDKPYRLAPVVTADGTIALGKLANPPELRTQPALSSEALAVLAVWAAVVDPFFDNDATDHECVIKLGNAHPVQARPVKRPKPEPTYLDMRKVEAAAQSPIRQMVQADDFLPGKSSVVAMSRREELLIAPTLEEAERHYKKGVHQLVIVSKPDPANSHPVVNFNCLGMPCLVANDLGQVRELLDKVDAQHPLVACVQTGALYLWDSNQGEAASFVSQGYAVHPAKIAISIPTQLKGPIVAPARQVPQDVKTLLIAVRGATTQKVALERLKELQENPRVAQVWHDNRIVKQALKGEQALSSAVRERFEAIRAYAKTLKRAFQEAEAGTARLAAGERLKPLLHAKILHTLLIGNADKGDSVGQFAVVDIKALFAEAQDLIDYQKQLDHPPRLLDLMLYGHKAMASEGKDQWRRMLLQLERLLETGDLRLEELDRFKDFIANLDAAGNLPFWLAFNFPALQSPLSGSRLLQKQQAADHTRDVLEKMVATLPPVDEGYVRDLLQQRQELQELRSQIALFSNPETFDVAWQRLRAYTDPERQRALAQRFKEASPAAQQIALSTMQDLVELYDGAIKAMKMGLARPTTERIDLFKTMLLGYFSLLQVWCNHAIEPDAIQMHDGWTITDYLETVKAVLIENSASDERELSPSNGFSVAAAVMNSGAVFERHMPVTLEDCFTLIHQNLLLLITVKSNSLVDNNAMQQAILPPTLKSAMQQIALFKSDIPRQRTGLEVTAEGIEVIYNVPLRNHSAQVKLIYHRDTDTVTMAGRFYGEARERWMWNKVIADTYHALERCSLAEPTRMNDQEVTITWKADHPQQLENALNIFYDMCVLSLGYGSPSRYSVRNWNVDYDGLFASQLMNVIVHDSAGHHKEVAMTLLQNNLSEKTCEQVQSWVLESLFSPQKELRSHAELLLVSLYSQRQFRDNDILVAIQKGLASQDPECQAIALQLMGRYVDIGKKISGAEEIALKAMLSDNADLRAAGFGLIYSLRDDLKLSSEQMLEIIEHAASDNDSRIRDIGFDFAYALLYQDKAYLISEGVILLLTQDLQHPSTGRLFECLIRRGQYQSLVWKTVKTLLNGEFTSNAYNMGLYIAYHLVVSQQLSMAQACELFELIIPAIEDQMVDRQFVINLVHKLIEQNDSLTLSEERIKQLTDNLKDHKTPLLLAAFARRGEYLELAKKYMDRVVAKNRYSPYLLRLVEALAQREQVDEGLADSIIDAMVYCHQSMREIIEPSMALWRNGIATRAVKRLWYSAINEIFSPMLAFHF